MFKKAMKTLINNPGLKILSVVIAVVLWLIVVNYDNPEITKTYTIPVTVTNADVVEKMGKVYEVAAQSDVVTFYVKGKRSYIDALSASDFTATADFSQIVNFSSDENEKWIPITVSAKRFEKYLNITQKTVNMRITLEDLSTAQSYIVGETVGGPAEGYAIGEISVSPNLVKISGPQSIVSQVSKIVASVDVSNLSEDITVSVTPVLYDEDGNVIESEQLSLSQDRVTVGVQILGTKTVPVKCETMGTPADGYQFVGLEYAPESITIKGEPSILNNIHQITIPGEAINMEGATGDIENSIDITTYVSELGVSLVNSEENKIAVKALIERLELKKIEVPTTSLTVNNMPEEYEVTYGDTKVAVTVRGRSEELAALTAEQLTASIDLEGLQPGTYTVGVTVTLEEKFQIMGDVTLTVHVKEPGEETTPADTDADTGKDNNNTSGNEEGNEAEDDTGNTENTGSAGNTGNTGNNGSDNGNSSEKEDGKNDDRVTE